MQSDVATLPNSRSGIGEKAQDHPHSGSSQPGAPSITITPMALRRIVELKENLGLPVKGLRVRAQPRSPLRAGFAMQFVPAEEPDSTRDFVQPGDGIDLYVDADSAPYLEGATLDLIFTLISSDLRVAAPMRKLDTPEGRLALQIEQLLHDEVNPALASHGGGAVLIDCKDGVVFLELTGGCQGCSMAGATMKDGIETSLRARFPEIAEVRDITRHADGLNPYARF